LWFIGDSHHTKVDEYEALLAEEEEDNIESIKYKKRLIDYDEDYENYDLYLD